MAPKKSASRPRQPMGRKLQRWQVLLAAVIASFGAVIAALIPTLASSSGSDHSGSEPAAGHSGSLPTPDLTPSDALQVAITAWSEVPFSPAPGETFSFQGIVTGWSGNDDLQIFVIARETGIDAWEVSPPAEVLGSQKWSVTWKIPKPPIKARWSAVIMTPPLGAPAGSTSAPSPPSSAQYRSQLNAEGLDALDIGANSTPVQVP